MAKLNYASYAQAIELGMTQPNKKRMTETLFKFITDMDFVRDKNGESYVISKDQYSKWCAEKQNIVKVLKDAADDPAVIAAAPNHFQNVVIPTLISSQKEQTVYDAVKRLIDEDDTVDVNIKAELYGHYSDQDYGAFLGGAFLYAIICKNDYKKSVERAAKEKAVTESPEVQEYKRFREKFPKPDRLPMPDEIAEHEMPYVTELLRAYSNAEGREISDPEELKAYSNYKKNFDRQRKDYYAAETIRQSARDTLKLDEADGFDILKNETYDGVIDVCEGSYSNAVERLKAVLAQAALLPLSKNLDKSLLGWVSSGEKKGVCHMLVNDDRLRWVDDDD